MLQALFIWFYCLDFHDVLILLAVFTGLFCVARVTFGQYRIWKSAVLLGLLVWTAAVVAQTVFRRTPDASFQPVWQPFQSYVDALKAGGQKELLRSNFMNAVLFYPAGMLVVSLFPERWRFGRKLLIVLALFTVLSFAIELTQFHYCLGMAQTDDVIHNALGACVGASVFLVISKTIRYLKNRRGEIA